MSFQNTSCIEHSVHGVNVVITILEERIRDPEKVTEIKDAMTEVVSNSVCKNLIIDMGRVQFIGSVGFLAFLAMRRIPGVQNVVLCSLNEHVKELFVICRLIPSKNASSAPFHDSASVQSALEWCGASAG